MNYGELKAQFAGLLNRRDMTTVQQDSFMQQGISRIQRELRVPPMEASVSVTQDGSYTAFPIPSTLLELIDISAYDASGTFVRTLTGVDLQTALLTARNSGFVPECYARRGSDYVVGPVPATGMQLRIDYYAELPALSADTDTQTLTRIAPDLFIYAALSYAADFYVDKRVGAFEARYQSIKDTLQQQADLDDLTASKAMRPAHDYQDDLWSDD